MSLGVAPQALAAMLAHAGKAGPEEACGILMGEGDQVIEARPCANVAPDPARHFEIDPAALIAAHRAERAGGPQIIGYYHSHPNGLARPSATDRAQAAHDGRIWAILAHGQASFWRDGVQGFERIDWCMGQGTPPGIPSGGDAC